MGKLWNIIEDWRDGMAYPPSYRKIANDLKVSQSAFDTWKAPTEMPKHYNLLAISRLTGVPFRRVVDAAVEDTGLYDESVAERSMKRRVGVTEQAVRDALIKPKPAAGHSKRQSPIKRRDTDVG